MKYIIICTVVFFACFGLGFLLSKMILKKSTKAIWKILLTILLGTVFSIVVTLVYMSIHYSADETACKALQGNESVSVRKIDGGYFFDGNGTEIAFIFYPGAKVECEAYAPLMLKLAEQGIDCFLTDMPFNFAIFGGNNADKFIDNYTYGTWLISGHSMGGLMASSYAISHPDIIDGVVLLGAYSTADIPDTVQLLSIYGTNDRCLDKSEYEKGLAFWPASAKEVVIDGANHAQFGNYGVQSADGEAVISNDEQQDKTVSAIIEYFNKY